MKIKKSIALTMSFIIALTASTVLSTKNGKAAAEETEAEKTARSGITITVEDTSEKTNISFFSKDEKNSEEVRVETFDSAVPLLATTPVVNIDIYEYNRNVQTTEYKFVKADESGQMDMKDLKSEENAWRDFNVDRKYHYTDYVDDIKGFLTVMPYDVSHLPVYTGTNWDVWEDPSSVYAKQKTILPIYKTAEVVDNVFKYVRNSDIIPYMGTYSYNSRYFFMKRIPTEPSAFDGIYGKKTVTSDKDRYKEAFRAYKRGEFETVGNYKESDIYTTAFKNEVDAYINKLSKFSEAFKVWGFLVPDETATYYLGMSSDDGARGYISYNGEQVLFSDYFKNHAVSFATKCYEREDGTALGFNLEKGVPYPIYIEYFNQGGRGEFRIAYKKNEPYYDNDDVKYAESKNFSDLSFKKLFVDYDGITPGNETSAATGIPRKGGVEENLVNIPEGWFHPSSNNNPAISSAMSFTSTAKAGVPFRTYDGKVEKEIKSGMYYVAVKETYYEGENNTDLKEKIVAVGPYEFDKIKPSGTVTPSRANSSKKAEKLELTLTAKDEESGVKGVWFSALGSTGEQTRIENTGTDKKQMVVKQDVYQNGTYIFKIEDNFGNTEDVIYEVTNITEGAPILKVAVNPNTFTNDVVTLEIEAYDGLHRLKKVDVTPVGEATAKTWTLDQTPGVSWKNGDFTISRNGTYKVTATNDNPSGTNNTSSVEVKVDCIDKSMPLIDVLWIGTPSFDAEGDYSVNARIVANDPGNPTDSARSIGSGVRELTAKSGLIPVLQKSASTTQMGLEGIVKLESKLGVYTLKATDHAGNITEIVYDMADEPIVVPIQTFVNKVTVKTVNSANAVVNGNVLVRVKMNIDGLLKKGDENKSLTMEFGGVGVEGIKPSWFKGIKNVSTGSLLKDSSTVFCVNDISVGEIEFEMMLNVGSNVKVNEEYKFLLKNITINPPEGIVISYGTPGSAPWVAHKGDNEITIKVVENPLIK